MKALGQVADDQGSALHNLDASSKQLTTFFDQLGPFADASRPAFRSLGSASKTGDRAVKAAPPVIAQLGAFAAGTPELGKNLSIVLQHLDDRKHAVEKDPRSPGGQGYTGLEALLQYAYDQTTSTSIFDQNNHILKIGAFVGPCADYASEETLKKNPDLERQCGSRLGPDPAGPQLPRRHQARRPRRPRTAGRRKRADGDHDLPLPAVPAPVDAPAPAAPATPAAPSTPSLPSVPTPSTPTVPTPTVPGVPPDQPAAAARHPAPAATIAAAATPPLPPLPKLSAKTAATRRPRPSSSTTCWRHESPARPPIQRLHRRQPRARRGRDHARHRRGRLPGLQRQQRAAVRAHAPARRARLQRRQPRQGQRGPLGRLPHRRRHRHAAGDAAQPQGRRPAHAQARQEGRRRAGRLEGRHPAALGARPEVRRARHRAARRRSSPTARTHAGHPGLGPRRASTRSTTCSTSRRGAPRRATCRASATPSPAAAPTSTRPSRSRPQLFGHLGSVMANLSAPRTELPSLLQGARRRRAHRRAGLEDQRAPLHRRWPTPSRPSRATRRRSRTRSPRARRRCAPAPRRCACSARSSSTPRRSRATSTRPPTELRGALPTVNSALRVGTPVQRRSVALNDNLQGALGALEDLVKAPTTRRLAARPDGDGRHAAAAAALPRPVRHGLQLLEHLLDLRRRALLGARRHRLLAARAAEHGHAGSPGPTASARQGANEFAHGKGALPGSADQYVHNNVYGAGRRRERQRRLRRRPDRLHPGLQPAARQERQGRPLPGRRDRALPDHAGASGPTYAQFDSEGKGHRPEPRPRAGRRDVHRPARRPRRRHREAAAMRRKQRKGMPPFAAGLLTLARARAS